MTEFGGRVDLDGDRGRRFSGQFDVPSGRPRATVVFAHCLSPHAAATAVICGELTRNGFAVLRFHVAPGDPAVGDAPGAAAEVVAAARWLREQAMAPALLVGHSLGGAAVLAAAADIAESAAVVTIGARMDPSPQQQQRIAGLRRALLIMHSPLDDVVAVDNARLIYLAARHPKSFVGLDAATHLLDRDVDALYAAQVLAAWASRYVPVADGAVGALRSGGPGPATGPLLDPGWWR